MSQPYLFYSDRSPPCKNVIDTLKKLNKDSLVKMVCIDGHARDKLPPFLKGVPTLYLPDTKDVYTGQAIFSYIAKPVDAKKEIPVSSQQVAKQGAPANGDFAAWSFEGTSKMSETYSDWSNASKFSDDQSKFSFLGGPVNTPPPKTDEDFGSKGDASARMEALQKQRDAEFNAVARK